MQALSAKQPKSRCSLNATWALLALLLANGARIPSVQAQEPSSQPALQEIVITAEKRAQSIQTVPLSVTAISSSTIQEAGITDFMDYALKAPNLTFSYSGAQGTTESLSIAIRGIQGSNTTGFYVDELPLPVGVDPQTLDLERIEVLRGPQGTLYGSGSMGGTVRLITKAPDPTRFDAQGFALVDGGPNEGAGYQVNGALNVPLATNAAIRLDAFSSTAGGFLDRQFPAPPFSQNFQTVSHIARLDEYGASLSLLWTPTEWLSIRPLLMYQHGVRNGLPLADYVASNPIQRRLFNIPEGNYDDWVIGGISAKAHLAMGDITSATSYFHRATFENEEASDATAYFLGLSPPLPAAIQTWEPQREFVEELRFASTFKGPVQLVAGVFYQYQRQGFNQWFYVPGLASEFGTNLGYVTDNPTFLRDRAVYSEISYNFLRNWTATVGYRLARTTVDFTRAANGFFNGGPSTNSGGSGEYSHTPKAAIQFQPTARQNYYVLAAKGFRPGGPNTQLPDLCDADLAALGVSPSDILAFHSDSLWNYELGAKWLFPDQRVSLHTAVYWINWTHIQQLVRLPTCGFNYEGNGGAARSQGGEIELSAAPIGGLTTTLSLGYTDARITELAPDVSEYIGEPVQQVAPWTVSAALDYQHALSATYRGIFRLDYSYVDNSHSAANDQLHPRLRAAYEIANARVGIGADHWSAFFFTNNLTNARPNLGDNESQAFELPGRPRILTSPPRTFGVEVQAWLH